MIFGDDHHECFTFAGFPALAVWASDELVGAAGLPRRPGDIGRHDAATGHWSWSGAVALETLAAGVHLAYRGRPEARGAAWLAVLMLVAGLSLVGWQWHRSVTPK